MFHLETFGGLRLTAADGRVVPMQRRRLGMLAVMAAGGDRGVSRDRLLALLWPESSTDTARHALSQALHGIRRTVSEGAIAGVDPVALVGHVVSADVQRFEAAVAEGALIDAIALYRGPFLDGTYLGGAPEFELWVERERAHLRAAYLDALDRLARDAGREARHTAAVEWRRRLAQADPLDARAAAALMRALAAAGDSAGALAYARTYERIVRAELEAPPDPAVLALTREIREMTTRAAALVPAVVAVPTVTSAPLAVEPAGLPGNPDMPPARRARTRLRAGVIVAAAATLLALTTLLNMAAS